MVVDVTVGKGLQLAREHRVNRCCYTHVMSPSRKSFPGKPPREVIRDVQKGQHMAPRQRITSKRKETSARGSTRRGPRG